MRDRLYKVLMGPHISEKSTLAADTGNQVVFKVAVDADKAEVKQAVEGLFDVEVESVSILNVKGKSKRFGRFNGRRKDWKKAYVRLKDGQDIDFQVAE